MPQRERFLEDAGFGAEESDVDPVILSRDNARDAGFRVLAGFIVSALHSFLSNCHLVRLSGTLLLKWDQIGKLQESGPALPALLESFPEREQEVLHLSITCRDGISLLELDDALTWLSEELTGTSVFSPEDTVYLKAHLRMDCSQSGLKRRRIEWNAEVVTEDDRGPTTVKEEEFILAAQETAPPSDAPCLTPPLHSLNP